MARKFLQIIDETMNLVNPKIVGTQSTPNLIKTTTQTGQKPQGQGIIDPTSTISNSLSAIKDPAEAKKFMAEIEKLGAQSEKIKQELAKALKGQLTKDTQTLNNLGVK